MREAFYEDLLKALEVTEEEKRGTTVQAAHFLRTREARVLLEKIVATEDFTAERACQLLEILRIQALPKDFLQTVYDYLVKRSFPAVLETPALPEEEEELVRLYLRMYAVFCHWEKGCGKDNVCGRLPLKLLTEADKGYLVDKSEYERFERVFQEDYVYELMRLSQDVTPFNTLDHICGVYAIAMHITRQLLQAGLPVDIGRVAGAAACHDIGKYACVGENQKRVPYLHYYYSDVWYKSHDLPYMGNVAVNHSTWDLELETLSLESLILIYADFRVKNKKTEMGTVMHLYPLKESFDVILHMLDNVDTAKENRYKRVYAKLADFEQYMLSLGIGINPWEEKQEAKKSVPTVLLSDYEIVGKYKNLAIEKNIFLMAQLGNEEGFTHILDNGASERDGKILRSYLNIFDEYYAYLTQGQKQVTLAFLYNLLISKDEDVRNHGADLIGKIVGSFDEEYRKELPRDVHVEHTGISSVELFEKYFDMMLYPDHKMIPLHREWIRLNVKIMLDSLFQIARQSLKQEYLNVFLTCLAKEGCAGENTKYLIQSIKHISLSDFQKTDLSPMIAFLQECFVSEDMEVSLLTLKTIKTVLLRMGESETNRKRLVDMVVKYDKLYKSSAMNFLKYKIYKALDLDEDLVCKYERFNKNESIDLEELFLSNLKSATSWVIKKANIDIAVEVENHMVSKTSLQTAMHLCNLLKVSSTESVRNHAGKALLKIMPALSSHERNELCIELTRALEMQEYQFTRYIPEYLGQILLHLNANELDETLEDFRMKIKTSNSQVAILILRTVGWSLKNYERYHMDHDLSRYHARLSFLLGMLQNGIFSFDKYVKHEAFRVIGREVLGAKTIGLETKHKIFQLLGKKLLYGISKMTEAEIVFLNFSASLNNVYRFILEYEFRRKEIVISDSRPVAFFPGTFDPFTLSHKQIAKSIRDMGFAVYLAVDEFSWSKRTQPNALRRTIMEMSVADEMDIYIYPEEYQINIANMRDLQRLRESFYNIPVHMVVGSDVVINASSYKKAKATHSIHSFPHVIFERKSGNSYKEEDYQKVLEDIVGGVRRLSLPMQYEDISSTQIRDYIDNNHDIAQLVDPMAQKFIYEMGLYIKEQQYKRTLRTRRYDIEVRRNPERAMLHDLVDEIYGESEEYHQAVDGLDFRDVQTVVVVRSAESGDVLAFSILHWLKSSMYYNHFGDNKVCEAVRKKVTGRCALIRGLFIQREQAPKNMVQILLTEVLSYCIEQDYTYAVYKPFVKVDDDVRDILERQGFAPIAGETEKSDVYAVNMAAPSTLFLDFETILKEPFNTNEALMAVMEESRRKLQLALARLYKGNLVLSFDNGVLIDKLIHMVCAENDVPTEQAVPRMLGEKMCVPYGSLLNSSIIPNTVTKSLHTQKMYTPNLETFSLQATPYYLHLEHQVRLLSSFDRPIILIDDLLHKGYRMNVLDPLLKREQVEVEKLIVSLLTGRGKELMDMQNRKVDSAYFLPNLKAWFNEKTMYPFAWGDGVDRGGELKRYMFPSINFILPYCMPIFLHDCSNEDVFHLSKVCIENAIALFKTVESEYQKIYDKNFTLKQLGQVFAQPYCPDLGSNMEYDMHLKPSEYLMSDLERLLRIENLVR